VIEITGAKGGTRVGHPSQVCVLMQGPAHIFYMVWYQASGNGVGWGCYGNTPGCSLAIVWARTTLLPPWSFTASTSLLHLCSPLVSLRTADPLSRVRANALTEEDMKRLVESMDDKQIQEAKSTIQRLARKYLVSCQ